MPDRHADADAAAVPDAGDERGPFMHGEGCPDEPTGRLTDRCNCGQLEAVQKLLTPDAGDDTLRLALAEVLGTCTCTPHPYGDGPEIDCPMHGRADYQVDALLPRIREHVADRVVRETLQLRSRAEKAEAALRELVELKDGPRDDDYERRKPQAWERARTALDGSETP